MKKSAFVFLFVLLAITYGFAGRIVVSGKVSNFTGDTLSFSYEPYKLLQKLQTHKVPVKNGLFTWSFQSDVPVRAFVSFGTVPVTYHVTVSFPDGRDSTSEVNSNNPRLVVFYLKPESRLKMNVDAAHIPETLQFSGGGASENMFVNKEEWVLNSYNEKVRRNYHEPVYFMPDQFVQLNNRRFQYKLHFLDSLSQIYWLSAEVKEVFYWKFYAEWMNAALNYPSTHELYTSEKLNLPAGYFNFVKDAKTAPVGGNKGAGYFYFLDALMRKKYEMRTDSNQSFATFIQQDLKGRAKYEYLAYSLNKNFDAEVLDMFGSKCPYPDIASIVNNIYKNRKGMLPGSPSPAVVLMDASGKKFSFADYKGKYVFIDMWATWCGPCIKQIPDLLKLEKEYEGKDITFLSISFDKDGDEQKWKDYIKNNPVGHNQVRADAASHRLLTDTWNISMIPRFAILDREGKIVDANAPFPSSKEIRPALDKLLK